MAVKKTSAAKRTAKRPARAKSPLEMKAKKGEAFICSDGATVTSLVDLVKALDGMDDTVFYHHVTADRNDFAAWIADAIGAVNLAEAVAHVKDKHEFTYVLMRAMIVRG